jgi:hypothetical protein
VASTKKIGVPSEAAADMAAARQKNANKKTPARVPKPMEWLTNAIQFSGTAACSHVHRLRMIEPQWNMKQQAIRTGGPKGDKEADTTYHNSTKPTRGLCCQSNVKAKSNHVLTKTKMNNDAMKEGSVRCVMLTSANTFEYNQIQQNKKTIRHNLHKLS